MTPELERIGKILVEAEGGCWHDIKEQRCSCGKGRHLSFTCENTDFSSWTYFGRLLKIAAKISGEPFQTMIYAMGEIAITGRVGDIDQIPLLVATELARIIEEEKK